MLTRLPLFLLFLVPSAFGQLIDRTCPAGANSFNIAYSDKVICEIDAVRQNDVFRFRGVEGERPWIQIEGRGGSTSSVRPCFDLTGPTGDLTASTCPQSYTTPFSVTGDYSLRVFANSTNATVRYTLILDRTYPASPGAIDLRFSSTLSGAINPGIEQDEYTFYYGNTADTVVISATTVVGPGSACLDLFDPRGTSLITSSCLRTFSNRLPRTGRYVIRVTSQVDSQTPTYDINLQCIGVCPPEPPPCDFTLSPVSRVFPSTAGTGRIGVTARREGCEFTAVSNSSFLTILGSPEGTAPATVTYQVTGNGNPTARNGILTIAGRTFPVTQAGSAPLFLLTPGDLSFGFQQGGERPVEQLITLVDAGSSTAFSAVATTQSGGNWLTATARPTSSGVAVAVNPASLGAGTYTGTVTVTAPAANPTTRTVGVTLVVEQNGTPQLAAEGLGLSFSFARGAVSRTGQVRVSNRGGGTLPFRARAATFSGGSWLSLQNQQGELTTGASIALAAVANPASLPAGTYSGNVTVEPVGGGNAINLPVTMTISDLQQSIVLSQTGMTYFSVLGGGTAPPQTFGVLNGGQGVMDWTVRASTLVGDWLRVNRTSGSSDAASLTVPLVEVSVNPSGLGAGEYYGQVEVSSSTAVNRSQVLNVVLQVLPAGSDPPPLLRPTGLIFTGVAGGATPAAQSFNVTNLSANPRRVKLSFLADDLGAYRVSPTETVIQAGQTATFQVNVERGQLTPAIRRAILTLGFLDEGSAQYVSILFALIPPATGSSASRFAAGCTPRSLLPVFASLGNRFQVAAAWPIPVEVRVIDDCGDPLTGGQVTVSFSNGDRPLSLVPLRNGIWSGTWLSRDPSSPLVTLTALAQIDGITGTTVLNGQLVANPSPPIVDPAGLPSISSLGGILAIFGSRLAETENIATLPLPTQINGTSIVVGGRPLPLFYTSPNQVNAQLPYDLAPNTIHQLTIRRGGTYAIPVPLTVATSTPLILTSPEVRPSQGRVFHQRGGLAGPADPARRGEVLVIYCFNLGPVSPPVPAGAIASTDPARFAVLTEPTRVVIGGRAATVQFAGLVPGFAAVYQINVKLDNDAPTGDSLPLTVTVGDQTSETVVIAVN